jgi:hypothetical protein
VEKSVWSGEIPGFVPVFVSQENARKCGTDAGSYMSDAAPTVEKSEAGSSASSVAMLVERRCGRTASISMRILPFRRPLCRTSILATRWPAAGASSSGPHRQAHEARNPRRSEPKEGIFAERGMVPSPELLLDTLVVGGQPPGRALADRDGATPRATLLGSVHDCDRLGRQNGR